MILLLVLKALYFFLPAYFGNMAPVIFKKVPLFGFPVSENYFGSHKTWRGLFAAVVLGTVIFWTQIFLYSKGFTIFALLDYSHISIWLGTMMGAGAILGDLIKSYYKRKAGIKPGASWQFWDQIDFVVGGLIGALFFYTPPIHIVVLLLFVSPFLHIFVNFVAYTLRIRETKF